MNVTGLATGLAQAGRYILGRKEQERAVKQKLSLEAMKNAMWNRRLQEQTKQYELNQERLFRQYKANQEAEVRKKQIEADLKREAWELEAPKREKELERINAEIAKLTAQTKGTGGFAKSGKDLNLKKEELELKKLELALKQKEIYGGKYFPYTVEEGGTTTRLYEQLGKQPESEYLDEVIRQSTEKLHGIKFNPPQHNKVNQLTYPGMLDSNWVQPDPWSQPYLSQQLTKQPKKQTKKESWKDYLK